MKKFLTIILLFSLSIGMFVGCNNKSNVAGPSNVITDVDSFFQSRITNSVDLFRLKSGDFTELTLIADSVSNTSVRFFINDGLTYYKYMVYGLDHDVLDGFLIKDQELLPTYRIFVYTKKISNPPFNDSIINSIALEYEKKSKLDVIRISQPITYKIGQKSVYIAQCEYKTDPPRYIDFYYIHIPDENYFCYIIYDREMEDRTPIGMILRTIDFVVPKE